VRRAPSVAVSCVAAVLSAALLAGCRGHEAATQPPAVGIETSATAGAPANGAAGSGSGSGVSDPSDAGLDSDLNAVDGQLSGLDSALAQATQSPSDGG
jgi:hypothetical protein